MPIIPINFKYISQAEKYDIVFSPADNEDYNSPISLRELLDAISSSHDSAPGPDDIHYQFLEHLPNGSQMLLLDFFNHNYITDLFPDSWHNAAIIPIPKPHKDHSNTTNYRPIALTTCLCNIFEWIINNRLMWYLETNKFLSAGAGQSGFRKQRNTSSQIRKLFTSFYGSQTTCCSCLFFDVEKAYDTTWKHGILRDLSNSNLQGHLPNFFKNFPQNRKFSVRLLHSFFDEYDQEAEVPQSSILSTTFYS